MDQKQIIGWFIMVSLSFSMFGCEFSDKQDQAAAGGDTQARTDASKDSKADSKTEANAKGDANPDSGERAEAVFAGGCFWCVEAVFEELEGVVDVVSGYAGDSQATANYDAVKTGGTKHAEVVRIVYDPKRISFEKLMSIHFATHDPTTKDRQGNDFGPQYRSAIFYSNDQEKQDAAAMIKRLDEAKTFNRPIVTTLEPLVKFYEAEIYHQNYACDNLNNPYIQNVAMPKVEKVRKLFKDDLKKK